ncbi:MAG: PH domain-containing protein, partial [Pseudomonadota bacterium]
TMLGLLVALLMAFSGLLSIVRFYGYLLTDESEGFKSRFGLFDRREKTLKKIKLHSIEMVQTAIGRAIGRWHLIGHQTGMNLLGGPEMKFLVPGVADDRIDELAGAVDDYHSQSAPDWRPIDRLFRTMLWLRFSVLLIAIAVLLQFVADDFPKYMDLASLGVLTFNGLLLYLIHLRCKRWGYLHTADIVMIRSGLVGQNIMRFEPNSVQQISVTQSPLQRRRNIASITIRLPHGEVSVPWIPLDDARSMANRLLYQIESKQVFSL